MTRERLLIATSDEETDEAVTEKCNPKDRRRSQRWSCKKEVCWRVRGGRRVRSSIVPEQSLHGLVIVASKKDAAPAGTYVLPGDFRMSERYAFRMGVICRTVEIPNGMCRLHVDILD